MIRGIGSGSLRFAAVLAGLALAGTPQAGWGQSSPEATWSAEVFIGTAWSLPSPLRIQQPGEPEIRLRARYATRPWKGVPYYAYRFGRWPDGEHGWEAELVHHKLYLTNPPPEVQHFEVSHGYNLVTANRSRVPSAGGDFVLRFGVGLVIGHPEGRVRERPVGPVRSLLGGGYHISGVATQLSAGRRFGVVDEIFFTPEAKLSASYARMPIGEDGWAIVPNVALHVLAGLGHGRPDE